MFHLGMWRERLRNGLADLAEGREFTPAPSNIDEVNEWVSARNALVSLRAEGLALIADHLEVGDLRPAEARPAVDLLVAEALWRRATSETPDLSNFFAGNVYQ